MNVEGPLIRRDGDYVCIHHELLQSATELGKISSRVFIALLATQFAGEKGQPKKLRKKRLRLLTGLERTSLDRAVRKLEAEGILIEDEEQPGKFYFSIPEEDDDDFYDDMDEEDD